MWWNGNQEFSKLLWQLKMVGINILEKYWHILCWPGLKACIWCAFNVQFSTPRFGAQGQIIISSLPLVSSTFWLLATFVLETSPFVELFTITPLSSGDPLVCNEKKVFHAYWNSGWNENKAKRFAQTTAFRSYCFSRFWNIKKGYGIIFYSGFS